MIALLPDLRAFARFLARDRVAADDLVQDTILRALGALDRFDPFTNLRAWMFTIERNLFFEQSRRRRTERAVMERAGRDVTEASLPSQEDRAELGRMERLIWTLPPLLREALVLVGAQGLSYEEAADICGVPVGTMKARVSRARGQVSRMVEREDTVAVEGSLTQA